MPFLTFVPSQTGLWLAAPLWCRILLDTPAGPIFRALPKSAVVLAVPRHLDPLTRDTHPTLRFDASKRQYADLATHTKPMVLQAELIGRAIQRGLGDATSLRGGAPGLTTTSTRFATIGASSYDLHNFHPTPNQL